MFDCLSVSLEGLIASLYLGYSFRNILFSLKRDSKDYGFLFIFIGSLLFDRSSLFNYDYYFIFSSILSSASSSFTYYFSSSFFCFSSESSFSDYYFFCFYPFSLSPYLEECLFYCSSCYNLSS